MHLWFYIFPVKMDEFVESMPCVCFEVEKVIAISNDGNYQVQWAPVWVSRLHLVGCEHLIQEFLQRQPVKSEPGLVDAEMPCSGSERNNGSLVFNEPTTSSHKPTWDADADDTAMQGEINYTQDVRREVDVFQTAKESDSQNTACTEKSIKNQRALISVLLI